MNPERQLITSPFSFSEILLLLLEVLKTFSLWTANAIAVNSFIIGNKVKFIHIQPSRVRKSAQVTL